MAQAAPAPTGSSGIDRILREELMISDRIRASALPVLRHLLRDDDRSVFSEETIARVRGILRHLAVQLLDATAQAAGRPRDVTSPPPSCDDLTSTFTEIPALLGHVHALALEWQLTETLESRQALDPVLPPLVQAQIASALPEQSATGMLLLAAQARFMQAVRRMEYPLTELPGDLFHIALLALRAQSANDPAGDSWAAAAEESLRTQFDERRTRRALLEQVLATAGDTGEGTLALDRAGVALFLTALAFGSRHDRDEVCFATSDSQVGRLALMLATAGQTGPDLARQLLAIHPDLELPEGLDTLRPAMAAALLGEAADRAGI